MRELTLFQEPALAHVLAVVVSSVADHHRRDRKQTADEEEYDEHDDDGSHTSAAIFCAISMSAARSSALRLARFFVSGHSARAASIAFPLDP
jgi:hypothetical protein